MLPKKKIKKGTRVRAVSTGSGVHIGREYVVEKDVTVSHEETLVRLEGVRTVVWARRLVVVEAVRNLRVGDTVRRIKGDWNSMFVGDEAVIDAIGPTTFGRDDRLTLRGYGIGHDPAMFVLVEAADTDKTYDSYDPALLPLFTKLADIADREGYCATYDHIVAQVGGPTRAQIKALNGPSLQEQFDALPIGATFTFTDGTHANLKRVKVNAREYAREAYDHYPTRIQTIQQAIDAGRTGLVRPAW